MNICGIYKITSPTGKIYIGQSTDILYRLKRYSLGHSKNQHKLHNSINKYGWANHKTEILCRCADHQLNELELFYSSLFDSTNPETGLNIRECGGNRGRLNQTTKDLIAKSLRGHGVSAQTRERIRVRIVGKTPWNKGKTGAQIAWNKGVPATSAAKEKLRQRYLGVTGAEAPAAKRIKQFDLTGNEIKTWYGAKEIERATGFRCAVVNRCARGERVTAYGYKWKYTS